jgi:hypothetical protein
MAFGEPLDRLVVELAQQDAAAANRRRPGRVAVDVADLRVRDVGDGVRTRPVARSGRSRRSPSASGPV